MDSTVFAKSWPIEGFSHLNNREKENHQFDKKLSSKKQREENQKLRNAGKSYNTATGEVVKKRKMSVLTPCRLKCSEKLNETDRNNCFNRYWNLGSRDKRASYIASLISINPKKRLRSRNANSKREVSCTYSVYINEHPEFVCKSCFLKTFGEKRGFVQLVIQRKKTQLVKMFGLGRKQDEQTQNKI